MMASKEADFPGPCCKKANISVEALENNDVCKLSDDDFTTEMLYELNQYRKVNNISWEEFYGWILTLTEEVPKLSTLKVVLSRLEKTYVKLKETSNKIK